MKKRRGRKTKFAQGARIKGNNPDDPCCAYWGTPRYRECMQSPNNSLKAAGGRLRQNSMKRAGKTHQSEHDLYAPYCSGPANDDPCCDYWGTPRFDATKCMNYQSPMSGGNTGGNIGRSDNAGLLSKALMAGVRSLSDDEQDQIMFPYCLASPDEECCKYYATPRFDPLGMLCPNGQYPNEAGGLINKKAMGGFTAANGNNCPAGHYMMADGSCASPGQTMSNGGSFRNCGGPGQMPCGGRMKKGGRTKPKPRKRKFNTGGHAHIPQGSMGAPNHRHSIYNHVNEFHRNDPAYSGSDQDQHLSGHVNQAHQNNWYGQGEGSPGNNQTRMNRVNRMKKGGSAKRKFAKKATGGQMHVGGNTGCRMHTSQVDCQNNGCKWEFDYGTCH
jgi:hypothetical protein